MKQIIFTNFTSYFNKIRKKNSLYQTARMEIRCNIFIKYNGFPLSHFRSIPHVGKMLGAIAYNGNILYLKTMDGEIKSPCLTLKTIVNNVL